MRRSKAAFASLGRQVSLFVAEPPHEGWPEAAAPPGTPVIEFYNFYLSPETHYCAFAAAGFAQPEKHFLRVSPEGLARSAEGWWDELIESKTVCYYRARPAGGAG